MKVKILILYVILQGAVIQSSVALDNFVRPRKDDSKHLAESKERVEKYQKALEWAKTNSDKTVEYWHGLYFENPDTFYTKIREEQKKVENQQLKELKDMLDGMVRSEFLNPLEWGKALAKINNMILDRVVILSSSGEMKMRIREAEKIIAQSKRSGVVIPIEYKNMTEADLNDQLKYAKRGLGYKSSEYSSLVPYVFIIPDPKSKIIAMLGIIEGLQESD